uniref:Stromelysin-3 n=1 Tax=Erpetoichthys calabaricus TaxID=27687 RepID=A0A8C4T708_ERPCA
MLLLYGLACGVFSLHFFSIHCAPVLEQKIHSHNNNEYKSQTEWLKKSHLYKMKKGHRQVQTQETVKEILKRHELPVVVKHGNNSEFWKRPRCGVPDYTEGNIMNSRHRNKRFVLFGGRWEKNDLTYKIVRFPWQMNPGKVRHTITEALKVWSDVTPLTFREIHEGRADIIIDFTRYWHGDNLPFDGPGGILAHAFFPKTHREGDVHFDYDETWTVGNNMGTDLLQVAAHEFGHVLGLQHSLVPGAVMSPFYSFSYPLELSEDDKQGIQYLYGPPQTITDHTNTETNEIISEAPNACDTDFDAVSMIRGELFFFKSRYVWRIRNGRLQEGYPALASRHWRGIPERIDAAFEDWSGNIWFFEGQSYWIFDGERQISGPDPVQNLGLPITDVQAALMWGPEKNKKIYFFKGGNYWRFNPISNRVDVVYPRNILDWRGIPKDIDAAFQDSYGYAHFLRGKYYWKFDPVTVKVLEGYPRVIGQDFFNCPERSNNY